MIRVYSVSRTRENFIDSIVGRLKNEVLFTELFRYLPFAISIRAGSSLNHVVNESV